tara:strand:- start:7493 stop:14035 length:6543 start_codon:yes stop_codon:yes gene_type:complete
VSEILNRFFEESANRELPARPDMEMVDSRTLGPATLGETFVRGVDAGLTGLQTEFENFKGIYNTLTGDEEAAAANIRKARVRETYASDYLQGIDTFEEFLDTPTFSGFVTQAVKAGGQVFPSAVTSIAGAGTGALVAGLGRGIITAGNRAAAKRLITESAERAAKDIATPDEKELLEESYRLLRRDIGRGAIGGAFAAEYPPLAGGAFSEALESGREPDKDQALRALAVATPQAAVGVLGEVGLVKLFGKVAKSRAIDDQSWYGKLASDIARSTVGGALIESGTETVQEGIGVLNRMQMDDEFTMQEAQLRLAESAFAGFFGGGAIGGAGGTLSGTVSAVNSADIMNKAQAFLERGQEQMVGDQITEQQYGDISSVTPTLESEQTINAQLKAVTDRTSSKQAVFVPGTAPYKEATTEPTEVEINGYAYFAAFVKGRGTIISPSKQIVEEVVRSKASDAALQNALGYSAVTGTLAPNSIVVQALDADDNVISEEVTTEENRDNAKRAAAELAPTGGRVNETTYEKALEDRKRLFVNETQQATTETDTAPSDTDTGVRFQTYDKEPSDLTDAEIDSELETFALFYDNELTREQKLRVDALNQQKIKRKNTAEAEAATQEAPAPDTQSVVAEDTITMPVPDAPAVTGDTVTILGETFTSEEIASVTVDEEMQEGIILDGDKLTVNEEISSLVSVQFDNKGNPKVYSARDPERTFPNEAPARQKFLEAFRLPTNYFVARPDAQLYSASLLENAVQEKIKAPEANIQIRTIVDENNNPILTEKGRKQFEIVQETDEDIISYSVRVKVSPAYTNEAGQQVRAEYTDVPVQSTRKKAVQEYAKRAKRSQFTGSKYSGFLMADPTTEGKPVFKPINLQEITNLGLLLSVVDQSLDRRGRAGFTKDLSKANVGNFFRAGYAAFLEQGYQIKHESIKDVLEGNNWEKINTGKPESVPVLDEQGNIKLTEGKPTFNKGVPRGPQIYQVGKGKGAKRYYLKAILRGGVKGKEKRVITDESTATYLGSFGLIPASQVSENVRNRIIEIETRGAPNAVREAEAERLQEEYETTEMYPESLVAQAQEEISQEFEGLGSGPQFTDEDTMDPTQQGDPNDIRPLTPELEGTTISTSEGRQAELEARTGKTRAELDQETSDFLSRKLEGYAEEGLLTPIEEYGDGEIENFRSSYGLAEDGALNDKEVASNLNDLIKKFFKGRLFNYKIKPTFVSATFLDQLRTDGLLPTVLEKRDLLRQYRSGYDNSNISTYTQRVQDVLDTVLDENSLRPAAYIPGNDFTGPLIILRDTDNSLEQLINGGHEIGHALYNALKKDLLRQPEVRDRLMKSFLASASGKALIQKYDGNISLAFEEHFANEVAKWNLKGIKSKNGIDAKYKSLNQKLRDFWKELSTKLRSFARNFDAVSRPTPVFEEFFNAIAEAKKVETETYGVDAWMQQGLLGRIADHYKKRDTEGKAEKVEEMAKKAIGLEEEKQQAKIVEGIRAAREDRDTRTKVKESAAAVRRATIDYTSRVINSKGTRALLSVFITADSALRQTAGNRIADFFYLRPQQEKMEYTPEGRTLGFVGDVARARDFWQTKFEDEVGSFKDPNVIAGVELAQSGVPTNQLKHPNEAIQAKAVQVREFLENFYTQYVEPNNKDKAKIGRLLNFFPTVLDVDEISVRMDEFIDVIVTETEKTTGKKVKPNERKKIDQAVRSLMRRNGLLFTDEDVTNETTFGDEGLDPLQRFERELKLTKNVGRDVLQQNGFLRDPKDSILGYLHHGIKRVEWNVYTKDEVGNDLLGPALDKLTPENRAKAVEIIQTYLGYQTEPLSPLWRQVNSYGQFLQTVTILPFAALASLPELAGPLIVSKDFRGAVRSFGTLVSTLKETIKDRQQAEKFARDMGIITTETVATVWMTQAELDYMDPKVREYSDTFFRYTGLTFFTNFTRVFATNAGRNFILHHAGRPNDANSVRYLDELGLTAAEVNAWVKGGKSMTDATGLKVKAGIIRFVESSVLRPNAAERPVWASDPRWALVWQLKSFFWAYGKVIFGGTRREAATRLGDTTNTTTRRITEAGLIVALAGLVTLPLAMLGLELREYAKYGLAWLLPGVEADESYFRSDTMSWPDYMGDIIDRSGIYGPFTLVNMMHQQAEWGRNPLLPVLGPTAETIASIYRNGFDIGKTLDQRLIPIYNQL